MTSTPDRPAMTMREIREGLGHAIPAAGIRAEQRSVRPVIEHALNDYGYSPDVARALIDRLLAEEAGQ